MKSVSILGLGYIGLPTAAMFASHGVRVYGIDVDRRICQVINRGDIHIEEPFLADIVRDQVANGMIYCDTKVMPSDVFIIAVPTPLTSKRGADLSYVVSAGEAIAKVLRRGDLVILESTVPPRTTSDVLLPVLETSGLKAGRDFYLAHCPERVLPGQIIHELKHNSRVIGGIDPSSAEVAKEVYSAFVEGEMFLTDVITAELCKLMENTFRDVNIALANELSLICERLGANAWEVVKYANKHPRVNLHMPGPGVGGHCLAIDPWFVVDSAPELAKIIQLARVTNDSMPSHVVEKVKRLIPRGSKLVILGCTYKPDVDDLRESPILKIRDLLDDYCQISVVDPHVQQYNVDLYREADGAHLVLLGVHHKQFAEIDFKRLAESMSTPIFLDTRNYYEGSDVEEYGFEYHLLGAINGYTHDRYLENQEVAVSDE